MSVDTAEQVWTGTYRDAVARVDYLASEISNIDAQMGFRKPIEKLTDPEYAEYLAWRRSALYARECLRRERDSLRRWVRDQRETTPKLVYQDGSLRRTLATKLDEQGIDYSKNELDNLKRRIAAEQAIERIKDLLREILIEFGEHDPCGVGCGACELLARAEREAQ